MRKLAMKPVLHLLMMLALAACNRVETAKPKQADIINAVFASGNIISDNEYRVTANAEGYLTKSFVEEGARVSADMPLFQLSNDVQNEQLSNAEFLYKDALKNADANSPQRVKLELQLEQSKTQLVLDKKNYERYKTLLASNAVSQLDFDNMELKYLNAKSNVTINAKALADLINTLEINVENTKSQLIIQQENNADYYLRSNIEGEALEVYKKEGDLVRRGEVIALIGGGEKSIKLFISEEDINKVAVSQDVIVNLNTEKERVYEGVISKIYPSFDDLEQSFVVEASFTTKPEILFYNTQLQANIIIGQREDALVIPSQFLSIGDSVHVKGGDLKYVQVGIRNENWVEILNGLDGSDILQKPNNL